MARKQAAPDEQARVTILVGSTQYRSRFELAGRNTDQGFKPDASKVFKAKPDDLGNVAPGQVIEVSEAYAAHLCDGQMELSRKPGGRRKPVRLCTRMTDQEAVRETLDLIRAEHPALYKQFYPMGH